MNEHISSLLRNRWTVPTSVGVVAFSGGIGIGYILAKRTVLRDLHESMEAYKETTDRIEKKYEKDQEAILEQFKSDLDEDNDPELVDPAIDRLLTVVRDPEVLITNPVESDEPEVVINNVFAGRDDEGWDYEKELATRKFDEPYVIHVDEYFGDEMDFTQSTYTYYKGDDILVDEEDTPIYNYAEILGELKFGHGSKDPNVVYIRNEKRKGEFEVLLSQGQYAVDVLGLEAEQELGANDLRHSAQRFRSWD